MNPIERWRSLDRKLVAILRGIRPDEVDEILTVLIESGLRAIEIPLNSPEPFKSITRAVGLSEELAGDTAIIGAGTVLTPHDVNRVRDCGGQIIVSPNTDPAVIAASVDAGLISMPGVFTASEALLALKHGAHALKFFPASILGADGIAAIRAVVPPGTELCAVGGIEPSQLADYLAAGVSGFGIGSQLYRPGVSGDFVQERSKALVAAYDRLSGRPVEC